MKKYLKWLMENKKYLFSIGFALVINAAYFANIQSMIEVAGSATFLVSAIPLGGLAGIIVATIQLSRK